MVSTATAVLVTAVFAVLGVYELLGVVRRPVRPLEVVGAVLHALMCAGMIAMAWPSWWAALPQTPQVILYALATGWFLLLSLLLFSGGLSPAALRGHGTLHQVQHAVMMGAMLWMVLAMPSGSGSSGMGSMAAMHDMEGMSGMGGMLPPGVGASGAVLTAALAVSGMLLVADLLSGSTHAHPASAATPSVRTGSPDAPSSSCARSKDRLDLTMMAAMALAMAAMCWVMLLM